MVSLGGRHERNAGKMLAEHDDGDLALRCDILVYRRNLRLMMKVHKSSSPQISGQRETA